MQKHVFEAVKLGKAPFSCVGYSYAPGGDHCEYCGQYINNVFWVRGSGNHPPFKVGCDCILKTGDRGLEQSYKFHPDYVRAMRERKEVKAASVRDQLVGLMRIHEKNLKKTPHHIDYLARQGKTLYDYMDWMLKYAGDSGRERVLRQLKKYRIAA